MRRPLIGRRDDDRATGCASLCRREITAMTVSSQGCWFRLTAIGDGLLSCGRWRSPETEGGEWETFFDDELPSIPFE